MKRSTCSAFSTEGNGKPSLNNGLRNIFILIELLSVLCLNKATSKVIGWGLV